MQNNFSIYCPEIRFADIDAMGHVNNATYFTYFEQARIQFFRDLIEGSWDWRKHGILVVRNEMNYSKPVFLNDDIEIHSRCTHVGTKSFTISYEIKRGEETCGTGSTVLVCFDHDAQSTIPLPELWKAKLQG